MVIFIYNVYIIDDRQSSRLCWFKTHILILSMLSTIYRSEQGILHLISWAILFVPSDVISVLGLTFIYKKQLWYCLYFRWTLFVSRKNISLNFLMLPKRWDGWYLWARAFVTRDVNDSVALASWAEKDGQCRLTEGGPCRFARRQQSEDMKVH